MNEATSHCIHCGRPLEAPTTQLGNGLALCRNCGEPTPLSAVSVQPGLDDVDLSAPPRGLHVERSLIRGVDFRYRRFRPLVLFLIPFTAVWSGFSLWGIYGRQITAGEFDPATSLLGLPFLAGSVFLLSFITYLLFGTYRLSIGRGHAQVFRGVGPLGWTKTMPLTRDTHIRLAPGNYTVNDVRQLEIVATNGDTETRFGATLPEEVRRFFAASLHKAVQSS